MKDDNFFADAFKAKGAVVEEVPPTIIGDTNKIKNNFFAPTANSTQAIPDETTPNVLKQVQTGVETVLPGVKAIRESVEQKSIEPAATFFKSTIPDVNKIATKVDDKYVLNEEEASKTSNFAMGFINPEKMAVESLVTDIAKSKSSLEINKILKSTYKNVSDDVLKPIAEKLRKITDPKLIDKELQVIRKTFQPASDDLLSAAAKKYKSADEFVKAQGTKMYHGTGADFTEFKQVTKSGVNKEPTLQPIFLAEDAKTAGSFANFKGGKVMEVSVNPNANIFDFRDGYKGYGENLKTGPFYDEAPIFLEIEEFFKKNGYTGEEAFNSAKSVSRGDWDTIEDNVFQKYLKSKGYDGFRIMEDKQITTGILNPDVIKTKSQLTDIWNKANQLTPEQSLIQDAKKYKSADEFIKAQGEPVYHGTNADFREFDKTKIGSATDEGLFGRGFYFGNTKEFAEIAPKGRLAKNVMEVYLSSDVKLFDISKIKSKQEMADLLNMSKDALIQDSNGIIRPVRGQSGQFTSHLQELGYDGVVVSGRGAGAVETVIFEPSKIKTKSQLTDIWNKEQTTDVVKKSITKEVAPQEIITPEITQAVLQGKKKVDIESPSTFKKLITGVKEYVVDNWERVRQLELNPNAIIDPNTITPYQAEQLYHGRRASRLEAARVKTDVVNNEVLDFESKTPGFRADVNEYLRSLHAPERNAIHGEMAAGITDAQAAANLERLKNTPYYTEIQKVADEIKTINNEVLEILDGAGLLKPGDYETLTTTYKNHVPLQRVLDDADDIGNVLTGKGFGSKSSGLKKAYGSALEVDDILTNVRMNLQGAIDRAEKNRVGLNILKFARENEDLGFNIVKPKMIGTDFGGNPILEKINDPYLIPVMEKGKQLYIEVADKRLAEAYRNLNTESLGGLMSWISGYSRLQSGLATRFNPEFALPNKIRDLQEVMISVGANKDMGVEGIKKVFSNEKQSMLDVVGYIKGDKTAGTALYEQMMFDGGTTGGMALSTKEEVAREFANMKGKPREAAEWIIKKMDDLNTVFEDSTRLSVYKASLEQGLSREQAALNAKTASINFNKKGTGGPVINALWMFSNVSIQGSAKLIRAMKDPKVAAAVTTAVTVPTFAINAWNDNVDLDWRDKVSETDRTSSLPIMIPTSDGVTYITIPISWGVKPIKVGADLVYDISTGQDVSAGTATEKILSAFLNGYNPLGGTDLLSAITPTALDLPVELGRNKTWSGAAIRPDYNKDAPATGKYFESLKDSAQGKASITATEKLYDVGIEISPADLNYVLTQLEGGTGRFTSRMIDLIKSIGKGELPEAKNAPFLNRFFKSKTEEEVQNTSFYGSISGVNKAAARRDYELNLKADKIAEEARQVYLMEGEEAAISLLEKTEKENPALIDKVEQAMVDMNSGMTATDRAIKNMGVANGARAEWIKLQLKNKKSDEDRILFLETLDSKGLISDEVYEQLSTNN